MSSVRRLGVEIYGNARGYIGAVNQALYGTTKLSRGLKDVQTESKLMSNQMKAIGTTMRYAFAGSIVFGITSAVSKLGDFEQQLGVIDSLAGKVGAGGKFKGLGSDLQNIGNEALVLSAKFAQPVSDVETYMQRFYTSFKPSGDAKRDQKEMQEFVRAHLELVTALGQRAGDPNALAGGLASLTKHMPGGEKNIGGNAEALSNYFAMIISTTPNLSGQDIANASSRLSSAATLSSMSIKDVLGVYGLAAQSGGSQAIITRGITQLLGASLLHPTKPASKAIYTQAGLPTDPNQLAKLGGLKVLEQLIDFVQKGQKMKGSAKLNFDAIYNAFSRQESVRQFVNLLSNGGSPALEKFIKSLDTAAKDHVVHQRSNDILATMGVQKTATAFADLSVELVRGLNGPLNTFGDMLSKLAQAGARHPQIVGGIEATAATLLATRQLKRLPLFGVKGAAGKFLRDESAASNAGALGPLKGVLRFVTGINKGQAAVAAALVQQEELANVVGGGPADGSRANPYWVIISPFSQMFDPSLGGGGSGSKGSASGAAAGAAESGAAKAAETAAKVGGIGVAKAIARALKIPGAGAVGGALGIDAILGHFFPGFKKFENQASWSDYGNAITRGLKGTTAGRVVMGAANSNVGKTIESWIGDVADVVKTGLILPLKPLILAQQELSRGGHVATRGVDRGMSALEKVIAKEVKRMAQANAHTMGHEAQLRVRIPIDVSGSVKLDQKFRIVDKNGNDVGTLTGVKSGVVVPLTGTTAPTSGGKTGQRKNV